MIRVALIILFLAGCASVPETEPTASAPAYEACGTVDQFMAMLRDAHERPLWHGEDKRGHQVMLFGEPHGETWTIAVIMSPTVVCLLRIGVDSTPTAYPGPSHEA